MSGTANNPEDARAWSVDFAGDASQQPFGAGVEGSEPVLPERDGLVQSLSPVKPRLSQSFLSLPPLERVRTALKGAKSVEIPHLRDL